MVKYEDLTIEQRRLYNQLKDAIREEKDISPTLQEFGESDFLPVLTAMLECVTDPNCNQVEVLRTIDEIVGLSSFWKVISEDDRENIKSALERGIDNPNNEQCEKDKCKDFLEEIKEIEFQIWFNSVVHKSPILDFGDNRESRKDAAKKGMKFGAIGGAITALAVGLGLYFGTSAALTVLPNIIGIALVAALFFGATIGVVTYEILKPNSCVDTVYVYEGFDTIKQEANTAAK